MTIFIVSLEAREFILGQFTFGVPFALIMYLPVSHWTIIGFLDRWLGSACVGMICSIPAAILSAKFDIK